MENNDFIQRLIDDYYQETPEVRMEPNLDEQPEGFFLVNRLLKILVEKQIIQEGQIRSILVELHESFVKRGGRRD